MGAPLTVLHQSKTRIRLGVAFPLNEACHDYLTELSKQFSSIRALHFYQTNKQFAIQFDRQQLDQVKAYLQAIDWEILMAKVRDNPIDHGPESVYDIVSNALYFKALRMALLPTSWRHGLILLRAVRFVKEAIKSLLTGKLDMHVLDACAIFVSLLSGDFRSADTIIFLLNLGDQLEAWSYETSLANLEQSLAKQEFPVWIQTEEGEQLKVNSTEISIGSHIICQEGDDIPFDGTVIQGDGHVNESSITGEVFLVHKQAGDIVHSNTTLESGELIVEVTNNKPNARISDMIELIKTASTHQSTNATELTQKADNLVKYNFLGMALTYLLTRSISKALVFILVDYSCALKISTPISYISAINEGVERGIVIKGSRYLEVMNQIDTFVFDKTGTLTTSIPMINRIEPFYDYSIEDVLRIGACLEEHIYHPIAQAIVQEADNNHIIHEEFHGKITHVVAKGIISTYQDKTLLIGSKSFMEEHEIQFNANQREMITTYEDQYNLLYLAYGEQLIALFFIDMPLRQNTTDVLEQLKASGKSIVLLSGDHAARVAKLDQKIGFDATYSEVYPEDKHRIIQELQAEGRSVFMIGDGLNDSAALSQADIGAVFQEGSDLARQASDIIIKTDDLQSLHTLIDLSDGVQQKVQRNMTHTYTINSSLIVMGLLDLLSPSLLATLHNSATLLMITRSFFNVLD